MNRTRQNNGSTGGRITETDPGADSDFGGFDD